MLRYIKQRIKLYFRNLGKNILLSSIKDKSFTIFSNDCYGGEIYRIMQIPYNTPFIGLMLMGPCYLKFLAEPNKYLNSTFTFIVESKYDEINKLRNLKGTYPMGLLNDIEVHFLHYETEQDAIEKWKRRAARINWNNLKIKFSIDKDYSDIYSLDIFSKLNFRDKVSFSNNQYKDFDSNIMIPNNVSDATVTFRLSLKVFNLIGWLNDGRIYFSNPLERIKGTIIYHALRR